MPKSDAPKRGRGRPKKWNDRTTFEVSCDAWHRKKADALAAKLGVSLSEAICFLLEQTKRVADPSGRPEGTRR